MSVTATTQPTVTHPTPEATTDLGFIVNADALTAKIVEWKAAGYHVLSPAITIRAFAPSHGVNVSAVTISPDPAAGESYCDRGLMADDERALTRLGLQKIQQCAGISWIPNACRRTDPRTIVHLWEYQACGAFIAYDGTPQILQGTAEVDLRDASAQIGGWTPDGWRELLAKNEGAKAEARHAGQQREPKLTWHIGGWSEARVLQARRFGLRLAETKAMSAAIRSIGLKSKYQEKELARPFIVIRVCYLPDYSDREIRLAVAGRAMSGAAALFADAGAGEVVPFRRALPEAQPSAVDVMHGGVLDMEREPVPVGATVADRPATTTPAAPIATPAPTPAPAAPPSTPPPSSSTAAPVLPPEAVFVEQYRDEELKKRDGGTYQKAWATLSDGRQVVTVYGKFRDRLKAARDHRTPIIVHDKRSNRGDEREVSAIDDVDAPQDRPLPGIDPGAPIKL
ncbi:MAG: hypothetical protein AB7O67_16745 [Vicinamibacterales bacterium]